jgi:hypothetical protein
MMAFLGKIPFLAVRNREAAAYRGGKEGVLV